MGLPDDRGRSLSLEGGSPLWKGSTLLIGLLILALPILAVYEALQGSDSLSNLLAALLVGCMGVFVAIQLAHRPSLQVPGAAASSGPPR